MQATTFETWFSNWPDRVSDLTLGKTPAEAFMAATGIQLIDILRLGDIVRQKSFAGDIAFDTDQLVAAGASEQAVKFVTARMAMKPSAYRDNLALDRGRGDVQHQRYTMTQFPFLEIGDNKLLLLRHQWGIDRFIGNQLYWETYASFGTSHTKKVAGYFSQAMDYMFEDLVGRTLDRILSRSSNAEELVTESQMQSAWEKSGEKPSVCDWAILEEGRCVVIDATNHPLNFKLAQGLGDAASYSSDIDKIFTNKKFDQLVSTMDHLSNPGWQGRSHGGGLFIPLVVVPDSSVPNTRTTELDFQLRAKPKFARFEPRVCPPGIISYSDLRLLEGICEHSPLPFCTVLSRWRRFAVANLETLQRFIDVNFPARQLPRHILKSSREFEKLIRPCSSSG
ncbi:hypothetical protein ACFV24_25370 [Nocardia fluminea]|uniref:hypothetical protein n=1 Tax=Nocardia fluminea TaxID=134984 RepID=UPI00366F2276